MTRFALLTTLLVAASACPPTTAEIHCGQTLCRHNQWCEPKSLVCVLDEAPELVVDEPRVGSLIAGDTLTLRGWVRDDNGPSTLDLSLDEGKSWLQVPVTGTHFAARLALAALDYHPLGLTLRAHDSHHQATRHRVEVVVDNVAPALRLGAPVDGATLNLASFAAGAKVSGLASDGSRVVTLSVDVGDGPRLVTASSSQFELDWAAPLGEDGVRHLIRVTAVDLAGNRATVERRVRVDVVAPALSFTAPAADALLGPAFFSGGGVARGLVSAGATVTAQLGSGPQRAEVTQGQWSVAYAPGGGLDFKPQALEVVAVDEAGNKTRAVREVTVDVVPPVLNFTGPAQGARLNAASFPTGDEVAVGWNVSDGDPRVTVRDGAGAVVAGTLAVTTSATDNPKAYALTLTAYDRAGNQSRAQLAFDVDRVHPTVTAQTPVKGARNTATTAAIEFSEAVTGGPGLTLTPAMPGGAWTTPRRFEVSALTPDSVFTAAAEPVVDAFGNPAVTPPPTRFHTAPRVPASGATLLNDVRRFKVAADADGVLTLFTASPTTPASYHWARVNPKTGAVEDNRPAWAPVVGGDFGEFDVYAAASVNPDLSSHRVSAATTLIPLGINERRSWVRIDDSIATTELGMVGVVPARPFPAEGTALGEVGLLKRSAGAIWYTRAGLGADLAVGLGPPTASGFTGNRWELLEVRNQVFKRRLFACLASGLPATCGISALPQWADVAADDATSFAVADACSVYVYNTAAGARLMRVEPHAPNCPARACAPAWSAAASLAGQLRVASDRREDNSFVAAQRTPSGEVQVLRLPLDADCHGALVPVGAPVAVPAGAAFEPVSLGGKPALVYVGPGNALKVFAP